MENKHNKKKNPSFLRQHKTQDKKNPWCIEEKSLQLQGMDKIQAKEASTQRNKWARAKAGYLSIKTILCSSFLKHWLEYDETEFAKTSKMEVSEAVFRKH